MANTEKPNVEVVPLETASLDPSNANRGTQRGRRTLKNSLQRLGAGRSILLDKNNVTLAGNKTLEEARKQGFKKLLVVDSDGDTLVAVRRTDLKANDKKAKELAIADNRVGELDLSWDPQILEDLDVELSEYFEPIELDKILSEGEEKARIETIDMQPPPAMMWILLGVPLDRFDLVQDHLAALEQVAEISVQSARSDKGGSYGDDQKAAKITGE